MISFHIHRCPKCGRSSRCEGKVCNKDWDCVCGYFWSIKPIVEINKENYQEEPPLQLTWQEGGSNEEKS